MLTRSSANIAALVLISSFMLGGCTAVRVQPVGAEHKITHICINDNPRVIVRDFIQVMQEGFRKYGISSDVITGPSSVGCTYTSNYTARQTWDFATYLADAQIDIMQDGRQIASANYHLRGKGGYSLTKWANTRSKILPVIDQLFAQITPGGVAQPPASAAVSEIQNQDSAPSGTPAPKSDLALRLSHLKDAFDAGLITPAEYEAKRKELIASL
jgi:hypothetical protein